MRAPNCAAAYDTVPLPTEGAVPPPHSNPINPCPTLRLCIFRFTLVVSLLHSPVVVRALCGAECARPPAVPARRSIPRQSCILWPAGGLDPSIPHLTMHHMQQPGLTMVHRGTPGGATAEQPVRSQRRRRQEAQGTATGWHSMRR